MKIRKILSQHRRDLTVELECQHCGLVISARGYDDTNYHANVVPHLLCPECGRKAGPGFEPLQPKYPEGLSI